MQRHDDYDSSWQYINRETGSGQDAAIAMTEKSDCRQIRVPPPDLFVEKTAPVISHLVEANLVRITLTSFKDDKNNLQRITENAKRQNDAVSTPHEIPKRHISFSSETAFLRHQFAAYTFLHREREREREGGGGGWGEGGGETHTHPHSVRKMDTFSPEQ